MSKTREFELLGALVGHPGYPNAARGDVLTLEVGDDDLPTSDLLRSRVRPLGSRLEVGEGMGDKEAKGKAKEIIDKAKADAAAIIDKANADAQLILDAVKS